MKRPGAPTRLVASLAGLAAGLALAGCPRPLVRSPGPPPTATAMLAHLRARADRITSLRAEAKVDYLEQRGERVKLTMTFLVARPGSLRIDAESPLGGTVASLASDGAELQLLDGRENRFLAGRADACTIGRLLRVRLGPADLVEAVTGGAPLLGQPVAVEWDPEGGGHDVLRLRGDGVEETIRLVPRRWDVASVEVVAAGRVVYRLTHDHFEGEGAQRFPTLTVIEDPGARSDARLRFKSREVNVALPAGAFHLAAPPGLATERLDCVD